MKNIKIGDMILGILMLIILIGVTVLYVKNIIINDGADGDTHTDM